MESAQSGVPRMQRTPPRSHAGGEYVVSWAVCAREVLVLEVSALLWYCYDVGYALSTLLGGFYTAPRAGRGGESDLVFNCSCQ